MKRGFGRFRWVLLAVGLTAAFLLFIPKLFATAEPEYDMRDVIPFSVRLRTGEKTGLMEMRTGRWVVPPIFDKIKVAETCGKASDKLYGRLLMVELGGKWGFACKCGNIVVQPKYDQVSFSGEDLLLVRENKKWGVLDSKGDILFAPQFNEVSWFRSGLAPVAADGKYGIMDKGGKLIVPLQYKDVDELSGDLIAVQGYDRKWGYIDSSGRVAIDFRFDWAYSFHGGLGLVNIKGKEGYINREGRMVIEPQVDSAGFFQDGVAVVKADGKCGLIDASGKMIVEPRFDDLNHLPGRPLLAVLYGRGEQKSRYAYMDKTGKLITPWFDEGLPFAENRAVVGKDGKYGIIDESGKFIAEPQFLATSLTFQGGVIGVRTGEKEGRVDKDGRWVTQVQGEYYPRQKIVRTYDTGFFLDGQGNLLDHYANHMLSGNQCLQTGQWTRAADEFRAALRINPGDEAALYGLARAE